MLLMHIQLIPILRVMASLLGDVLDGFGNDGVVCYEFMSELVDNINGYVLIYTGGVI